MRYAILRSTQGVQVIRLDSAQAGCEIYEPLRTFRWGSTGFEAFDRAIDLVNKLNAAQEQEDWETVARLERRRREAA